MVKLMSEQREAVMRLRSGKILAGGVGSGKSLTSLAYYLSRECRSKSVEGKDGVSYIPEKGSPDLYIITTAKKRDNLEWESDMLKYHLKSGENRKMGGINITIQSWNNIGHFVDVQGAFFIFDEQRLVGSGEWVKSFYKIAAHNHWILLSATPGDTWSDYIPVFVANGFYKNKTQFMNRHAVYSRYAKFPKVDKWVEENHLKRLRQMILVPMEIERDTHRKVYQIICDYDKNLYKSTLKGIIQPDGSIFRLNPYTNEPIQNISELMIALRKIVNTDHSRIKECVRICIERKRTIIFYNLDAELEELRRLHELTGIQVAEWNGHKHEDIPDSDEWIYLVQYTAGCEGWNCITTDTIIFYSLNYSYKVMEQASGRIDRMNTKYKELNYYLLRSFAPIDVAILRALKLKKKFQPIRFLKKSVGDSFGKAS